MKRILGPVIGVTLVVVGITGMAIVGAIQPSGQGLGGAEGSYSTSGVVAANGVDSMFIREMIPHHDDAIEMADLALTRAEHPELKQLAEQIKRNQTAENGQMRGWYRAWFDSDVPTGYSGMMGGGMMGGGMMGGGSMSLDELSRSEPFDKAFIEQMIPHHQTGIMMARMAGNAAATAEIRELAASIIDSQSREIEQMQQWYQEWYGR